MNKDLTPEQQDRAVAKAKVDVLNAAWRKARGREKKRFADLLAKAYDEWERTLLACVDAVSPNPSVRNIIYKGRREAADGDNHTNRVSNTRRRTRNKRKQTRSAGLK